MFNSKVIHQKEIYHDDGHWYHHMLSDGTCIAIVFEKYFKDISHNQALYSFPIIDVRFSRIINKEKANEVNESVLNSIPHKAILTHYHHGNDTINGAGLAIEIFSILASCMRDYIKEHNPQLFSIASRIEEESRINLYERICKKFSSGYHKTYEILENDEGEEFDVVKFICSANGRSDTINHLIDLLTY